MWTGETWRARCKARFESAMAEGGVYAAWAMKVLRHHSAGDVVVWDRLPLEQVMGIWRDLSRLLQFAEPFELPAGRAVKEPLVPRQRTWAFLQSALSATN